MDLYIVTGVSEVITMDLSEYMSSVWTSSTKSLCQFRTPVLLKHLFEMISVTIIPQIF